MAKKKMPFTLPLTFDGFGINQSDQYAARLLTINIPPRQGQESRERDGEIKASALIITRAVNGIEARRDLAARISEFDRRCEADEHTDTVEAWELLNEARKLLKGGR